MVRAEEDGDEAAIHRVVEEAFGQPEEATLVDVLREKGVLYASSVAVEEGRVVGHAALSPARIGSVEVFALAPVAVVPHRQSSGIGTAVVNHVLAEAADSIVTVLGDPAYYSRFGFVDSAPFGVRDAFADTPGASQILRASQSLDGTVEYAKPFYDL